VQEDFISNLSRISQLTGFSDPIYAEAYVKMHGFDIMLGAYGRRMSRLI
jgi:coatomer subunit beta